MNSIINLVTGIVMIKCKKDQKQQPVVIEFENEKDAEDLSWMIHDNERPTLKLNSNKLSKSTETYDEYSNGYC